MLEFDFYVGVVVDSVLGFSVVFDLFGVVSCGAIFDSLGPVLSGVVFGLLGLVLSGVLFVGSGWGVGVVDSVMFVILLCRISVWKCSRIVFVFGNWEFWVSS